MSRKNPNMSEKLAAAYLSLVEFKEGKWAPVLDRIACKKMTAKEICSLFEVDHYPITVFMGGDNHPTNLVPMLKGEHRQKTYKIDALETARMRRYAKKRASEQIKSEPRYNHKEDLDPPAPSLKEELTERQRAYRKAVYQQRKLKRKKPHGWSKKKL